MSKYEVRYDNDDVNVKSRETEDGYTTIVEDKKRDIYTSIHEGENRETVVDQHYEDGSRTVSVFFDSTEDSDLLRQEHYDSDGNKHDAMPDAD